jgi:BirA family biotin operon repressor/biotin-[acetyl-CoA-carboxylase] ligase
LALNPSVNPLGRRFTELEQIGSTNDLARERIETGSALHGEVFFAWHQTAGRGQLGKPWMSSPKQNLAMTLVLENKQLPDSIPFHLSACCATACQAVLTEITRGDLQIKWPNDLYWKSRKLGGLLIETQPSWSIVGIGINVNQTQFDPSLPNPVSIRQITGQERSPRDLAKDIVDALNAQITRWHQQGFSALLNQYRSTLFGKDQLFAVREKGIEKHVRIIEVDESGGLILEENGQKRTVVSGIEWIIKN